MYRLAFSSDQQNLLSGFSQDRIQDIHSMQLRSGNLNVVIRQSRQLIGYEYASSTKTWHYYWNETIFGKVAQYSLNRYPWAIHDKILPNENVVILKHPDGIRFFQFDAAKPGLKFLAEDGNFHEVYDFKVLWGSFYPNADWMGVMTRSRNGEINFYAATQDSFNPDEPDPIFTLNINLMFTPIWMAYNTEFFVTDLRRRGGSQVIGLRSIQGLEFYQFNDDYILEKVARASKVLAMDNNDKLFFADLTKQPFKDILHLNSNGLCAYQYDINMKDYKFLQCNAEFSQSQGWKPSFSESINMIDINSDGRDDLIFTGQRGLKALTFDLSNNKWNELLTTDRLSGLQRYATVVGTLTPFPPAILHSSIFVQDEDGNVQWAQIEREPTTTTTTVRTTTTARKTTEVTTRRAIFTATKSPTVDISRETFIDKPFLRWTEQWEDSFIREAVDMGSGQIQFTVPLIDVSASTGWAYQLSLSYHSQAGTSDLIGVGWSLPLAQDYIFVDYRGSIFPKDAHYFLMMRNYPQRLTLLNTFNGIDSFKISDADDDEGITIKFYYREQHWIIDGPVEQTIYGEANNAISKDALQWGLQWDNWRGVGRDKAQLKPLIMAWYLNNRHNKLTKRSLYYNYDIDSVTVSQDKVYTSAIRLKNVHDNDQFKLVFDYASKNSNEYKAIGPIEDSGNIQFPVQLTNAHYLRGYEIVTATFTQKIEFIYKIDGENRMLTIIQQQMANSNELMLQFTYQNLLKKPVLSTCNLPRGSNVSFDFETLTVPSTIKDALRYPARERAKISYGLDYSVMAYRDLNSSAGKILLKILNREMTLTTVDCTVDENAPCPSAESEIKDFVLQTYQDTFVIFAENKNNRALYVYNRRDNVWSAENSAVFTFSQDALIRFSERVIVASEKNENSVTLFSRKDEKSDWMKSIFYLYAPISRISLHDQLIIAYDDNKLLVFYEDSQLNWQLLVLKNDLKNMRQNLDFFNLESDTRQQYLNALNQNGLQIINNVIMLSALKETDGQLYSEIQLYLLDSQFKVFKIQSFTLNRENLNNLKYNHDDKNSTFHLGYIKENGAFNVRIKELSGEIVKEINKNKNKNRRQDAMDDMLKQMNEAEGWKNMFKKSLLINWSQYNNHIGQLGVICGNDTFLRMTGTEWKNEVLNTIDQPILLGKYFVLEPTNKDKSIYKLYNQNSDKNKYGQELRKLTLHYPGQLLNRYPYYIAYHMSANKINLVTFNDEQTLGDSHTFINENLLADSDYKNLVTIANATATSMAHAESQEYLIRPSSSLITKSKYFVKKVTSTDGNDSRVTGFERSFSRDNQALTYSETVTLIPGARKNLSGWYEATHAVHIYKGDVTTIERYFDANDKEVLGPVREPSEKQKGEAQKTSANDLSSKLFDLSGKWLVSDFSPYNLADEIGGYFGFEEYEKNFITATKSWKIHQAQVVKGFAFTGENYLQLKPSSFIEGEFQPRHQKNVYLATCWIRCSEQLRVDSVVPYLKAILSTDDGEEFIRLQAKIKYQQDDWYYLELPLDFQLIEQIYKEYANNKVKNNNSTGISVNENMKFKINLRAESFYEHTIDLDHIRFASLTHDFQAIVYSPMSGSQTSIIKSNGFVIRTIYNRRQQEIGNVREDGQLEIFTSSSRTGKLSSSKIKSLPCTITSEPENGFYETFEPYAFENRWKFDRADAWYTTPGQLWHKQSGKHQIKAADEIIDNTCSAIRFYLSLNSQASLALNFQELGRLQFTRQSDNFSTLSLPNGKTISQLPVNGEVIVMVDGNFIWLWLDSVLLIDQSLSSSSASWSSFMFEVQGEVLIEDLLIMNRPQVKVEYFNAFGEKTQVINLENAETAQVTETLYDDMGREAIQTKTTRIKRSENQSLLAYRANFVTNKHSNSPKSVWLTGQLQGEVNDFNPQDQGFAYTRTQYASNPLNQGSALGLPGKDFSITGPYAMKMGQQSDIAFLSNLFPSNQGYRQQEEHTPNGSRRIQVFDKNKNQVARYVRVAGFNHLFSTFEYDDDNRLTKILPALYHEKVESAMKLTPWQSGEEHLSAKEMEWQTKLATQYIYDENGHLKRKITPDSGATEYLYNIMGQKRFMVSLDENIKVKQIVFFDYDVKGQLTRSGFLTQMLSIDNLRQYLDNQDLPFIKVYQQFYHNDDNYDPSSRGRVKYFITQNEGFPLIENLHFNAQDQVLAKSAITISGHAEADKITEIKKQYVRDKVSKIKYPLVINGEQLELIHTYNKLGQLVSIGTSSQDEYFVKFTYHASGQLAIEQFDNFTRNYHYNSPGFLEKISDSFLTETIEYINKGYGQKGFGDGMVMQSKIKANWADNADRRSFQVRASDLNGNFSTPCVNALKRTGYINTNGKPLKLYTRDAENEMPLICDENDLAEKVAEKKPPNYYGYRYAYGNHQELIVAKYFTEDTEEFIEPLQIDSFSKQINGLNAQHSEEIFQLLVNEGFLIRDRPRSDFVIGKAGKSFFPEKNLTDVLSAMRVNYIQYVSPIKKLILTAISQRKLISLADFETTFLHWNNLDRNSYRLLYNIQLKIAQEIYQTLNKKGYLSQQNFALDARFKNVLNKYSYYLPEIVKVLSNHFAHALGETPFDVESYNIDANGNHRLFYTGFNRYELTYRNGTNKIDSVKLGTATIDNKNAPVFKMKHDIQGNVIQALHKGIESIEYHPVSQRTTRIKMIDGRTLRFFYDAKGERVFKQVYDPEENIIHETRYLRDEQGRVLFDQRASYLNNKDEKIATAYIYGPRGLLGFMRNNKFYSVTTDHSGSVLLVIQSDRVVAAYDYLPYGQLMRTYGNDPEAHIFYRYTGQEWDEETGLYNYHARLYDPSIGRFYQPDPKAQYFSPYKYAGNSPVSLVDPDGEFAFLIACLILGAVGAYLGGAAANNRWNPVDWDFEDHGTWLGIFGGAIAGGLLPVGFGASAAFIGGLAGSTAVGVVSTIGLGVVAGYVSTSASQGWDPTKYKWDQPGLYNSAFQGFSTGASIMGGIGAMHSFANAGKALNSISVTLSISRETGKWIFLAVSYSAGAGAAYGFGVLANEGNAAFWEWDWTNPATWDSLLNGLDAGMGWPQNFMELGRGIGKVIRSPSKLGSQLVKSATKREAVMAILKNPQHPLYKVTTSILMAYFMGSAGNEDLDITRWNLASFSTYAGVLNGVFFGKDIANMLKLTKELKIKMPPSELVPVQKSKNNYWSRKLGNVLDNIQMYRQKIDYQQLVETIFTSTKMKESIMARIKDKSTTLKKDVENFFTQGIEKWHTGESKPPKEFTTVLLNQIELDHQNSLNTLNDMKIKNGDLAKKQQEVFPDRDVDFLKCGRGGRRRKRAPGADGCFISMPKTDDTKPEIMQQFFEIHDVGINHITDQYQIIAPADKNSPNGFSEHLSMVLEKTPVILGPTKKAFYNNVVLGSLATSNKLDGVVYAKIENLNVKSYFQNEKPFRDQPERPVQMQSRDILSVYFKVKVGDATQVVLRTFIAEGHDLNPIYMHNHEKDLVHDYYKKEFTEHSKISVEKLSEICKTLKLKDGNYKVDNTIYFFNADHTLDVKKESSTHDFKDEALIKESDYTKVEPLKLDYDAAMNKIASNNMDQAKAGVKEYFDHITEAYMNTKENKNFRSQDSKETQRRSESEFHAFVYGALSLNSKYKHNLDIYVERIAGRGYADMMFLSRAGVDSAKNWQAIPIVVEFKADKTTSVGANDQIIGTGYLHNLSMRTVAENALIVGVNPYDRAVEVTIQELPKSEGFANRLMNSDPSTIKENLTHELMQLYYSISPLAIKTTEGRNQHYLSHMVLGELLSKSNLDVYIPKVQNDNVRSILFTNKDTSKSTMLNLIESSVKPFNSDFHKFRDVRNRENLLPLGLNLNDVTVVDVKINSKSNLGWSLEIPKREYLTETYRNADQYYFQSIDIKSAHDVSITKSNEFHKLDPVNVDSFFSKTDTKPDNVHETELKKLKLLNDIVNSESDVQAILQGMFIGTRRKVLDDGSIQIVKVFPEANLSKEGRIDLLISKLNQNGQNVKENALIVMEIKYTKDGSVDNKINEAIEQIGQYASSLKSVTDLKKYKPIVVVFDKVTGESKVVFIADADVIHTSDSDTSPYLGPYSDMSIDDSFHLGPYSDSDMSIDDFYKPIAEGSNKRPRGDHEDEPDEQKNPNIDRKRRSIHRIIECESDMFIDTCFNNDKQLVLEHATSTSSRTTSWINSMWKGVLGMLPSFSNPQMLKISTHTSTHSSSSSPVCDYTSGHFNGLLQLLDLFIRKQTGQKYSQPSIRTDFDHIEKCLHALDNAPKFIETLKNYENAEIPDEFICYQALLAGKSTDMNFFMHVAYPLPKITTNFIDKLT